MRSSIGIDSNKKITEPTDENTGDLKVHPNKSDLSSEESLSGILTQMKLLNSRFEEAFRTGINLEDVTNED